MGRFQRRREAFSLPELIVALAVLAITLLALVALAASSLGYSEKSNSLASGAAVAETQLERVIQLARGDNPPGEKARFWDNEYPAGGTPYLESSVKVGNTEYKFKVHTTTLRSSTTNLEMGGDPLLQNRMKKVDITVFWWTEEPGAKAGYGKLSTSASRIVNENPDS